MKIFKHKKKKMTLSINVKKTKDGKMSAHIKIVGNYGLPLFDKTFDELEAYHAVLLGLDDYQETEDN